MTNHDFPATMTDAEARARFDICDYHDEIVTYNTEPFPSQFMAREFRYVLDRDAGIWRLV